MSTNESEQSSGHSPEEQEQMMSQYLLPAAIQFQSAFVIEIIAKRYPVEISPDLAAHTSFNLENIALDENNFVAQVTLGVSITTQNEPKPFDLSFKIVGSFIHSPDMPRDVVLQFLNQGSLGVLLPFARELLMSLCMRFQIPIIILPMIQLTLPPSGETPSEKPQDSSSQE